MRLILSRRPFLPLLSRKQGLVEYILFSHQYDIVLKLYNRSYIYPPGYIRAMLHVTKDSSRLEVDFIDSKNVLKLLQNAQVDLQSDRSYSLSNEVTFKLLRFPSKSRSFEHV